MTPRGSALRQGFASSSIRAGFDLTRIVSTASPLSIAEAKPKA